MSLLRKRTRGACVSTTTILNHVQLGKAPVARTFATLNHGSPFYSTGGEGLIKILMPLRKCVQTEVQVGTMQSVSSSLLPGWRDRQVQDQEKVTLERTEDRLLPKSVTKMNCLL